MLNGTNHQGNSNQNHNELPPHTCKDSWYQEKKWEGFSRVWNHWTLFILLVRIHIGTSTMENSMGVSQRNKNRTALWSRISKSRYLAEDFKSGPPRDISIPMFIEMFIYEWMDNNVVYP